MNYDIMDSPIGELLIREENGYITQILFFHPEDNCDLKSHEKKHTPLIEKCILQLNEYFEGKRKEFDLPLNPSGTEFQKKRLGCPAGNPLWQNMLLQRYCHRHRK